MSREIPSQQEMAADPMLRKDAREPLPLGVRLRRVYDETRGMPLVHDDDAATTLHDSRSGAAVQRVFNETRDMRSRTSDHADAPKWPLTERSAHICDECIALAVEVVAQARVEAAANAVLTRAREEGGP